MMAMTVFPVDFALRQYVMHGFIADSMLVSAGLILVYCLKFFYWESGYWCSMDIMHDRAGPHLQTCACLLV